jgi:hypothetical protein
VLPAILVALGPRVNAGSPRFLRRAAETSARPATSGGWYRLQAVGDRLKHAGRNVLAGGARPGARRGLHGHGLCSTDRTSSKQWPAARRVP